MRASLFSVSLIGGLAVALAIFGEAGAGGTRKQGRGEGAKPLTPVDRRPGTSTADRKPAEPPPPMGITDEPGVAFIIDGEKIDRAAYGEALITEFGATHAENFVLAHLIQKRAKELGLTVTPEEIDALVETQVKETLERRFRGNEAALRAQLQQNGLTMEDWKERLRRPAQRDALAKALVKAERDVSEAALQRAFEEKHGKGGVQRVVRHIFLSTNVYNSTLYSAADYEREKPEIEAAAASRAAETLSLLKSDPAADFAAIARERSEDHTAEKGGDYGRFWKNRLGPEVDAAVARLEVGQLSEVLKGNRGYVIIKVTGLQEGYEFKARHILLSTKVDGKMDAGAKSRKEEQVRAEAASVIERLKGGEDFEKIARERSDDPGSKAKGGDLGTFGLGRMVAPFEQALLALQPGEVTQTPVQTPYGFHVIKLEAKARKPENDTKLVSAILFSTEFPKVKERKLKGNIEERAKAKAEELFAKVKAGEDMAALAREHSEDQGTKAAGGLIEDPSKANFGADFERALLDLSEAAREVLVRSDRGYHILKLEKIEKTDFATAKEALLRELKDKDVTANEVRELRDRLRGAAKVERGRF